MRRLFMLNIHPRLGQSGLEYGVFLVLALAALLTMQAYFKNSVQGRVRGSARDIGETGGIEQPYYPGGTTGNTNHAWRDTTVTQTVLFGVDQGGNMTNSDPYEVRGAALTTGNFSYDITLNESMGAN